MAKARKLRTFAGALYSEVWFFVARTKVEAGAVFFDILPRKLQKECTPSSLTRYVAPLCWCPKKERLWFDMNVATAPRGVRLDLVPEELLGGVETCQVANTYVPWGNYGGKGPWKLKANKLRRKDGVSCAFFDADKLIPLERAALLHNDSAALRIAREITHTEDYTSLPILADALEEAGVTSSMLLEHCRQVGPHHAGCWAAELVAKQ